MTSAVQPPSSSRSSSIVGVTSERLARHLPPDRTRPPGRLRCQSTSRGWTGSTTRTARSATGRSARDALPMGDLASTIRPESARTQTARRDRRAHRARAHGGAQGGKRRPHERPCATPPRILERRLARVGGRCRRSAAALGPLGASRRPAHRVVASLGEVASGRHASSPEGANAGPPGIPSGAAGGGAIDAPSARSSFVRRRRRAVGRPAKNVGAMRS